MSVTCGRTSPSAFAFYDPDSRSLRTSQATFLLDSTPYSVTLPPSGSMSNGWLCERRMLAPVIDELACSSSLPTPSANLYEMEDVDAYLERRERQKAMGRNGNGFGLVLSMAVKMLPTPNVPNGGRRMSDEDVLAKGNTPRGKRQVDLASAVRVQLLPTPTVDDSSNVTRESGEYHSLTRTVRTLPTPTTSDAKGPSPHGGTTSEAIRDLCGATTAPPSNDTPESSDGQLPLL